MIIPKNSLYCKDCLILIQTKQPPERKEWLKFLNCRCLSVSFANKSKEAKNGRNKL